MNNIVGFILLAYSEKRFFDSDTRHIAYLFQELANSVLQRVNIQENLEKSIINRTQELRTLYEVTALLNDPLSLNESLNAALERILDFTHSDAAAIHVFQPDLKKSKLIAYAGVTEIILPGDNSSQPCVWDAVFEQDRPLELDDLSPYPGCLKEKNLRQVFYFGVPIRSRGQTLGTLSIFCYGNQEHLQNYQVILMAIADQFGMAIERARLIEQAEEAAKLAERQRLARDLHDALSQSLYSLTLLSKAYQRSIGEASPEEIEQWLREINEISLEAMKELRLLLYELRPTAIEQDGLQGALQRRLDAVERRAMIEPQLTIQGSYRLPPYEEEQVYRIAQEALNNALQHAHHKRIEVNMVSTKDYFEMRIIDDGVGFDVARTLQETHGMGLANMLARAEQLGAQLTIRSVPLQGTMISLIKRRKRHE